MTGVNVTIGGGCCRLGGSRDVGFNLEGEAGQRGSEPAYGYERQRQVDLANGHELP